MSKAGKGDSVDAATVGSQHPVPENIPHASSLQQGGSTGSGNTPSIHHPGMHGGSAAGGVGGQINSNSPIKESSFLQRGESVDDSDDAAATQAAGDASAAGDAQKGLPIRG